MNTEGPGRKAAEVSIRCSLTVPPVSFSCVGGGQVDNLRYLALEVFFSATLAFVKAVEVNLSK